MRLVLLRTITAGFSLSTDLFWINRSHEQVYIPDDGSFEFRGPSRAYGFEAKAAVQITRHLAWNGGITKVANASYLGAGPHIYVDSAPHFVANSGFTVSSWKGWNAALTMRAINHYRLAGMNPSIMAGGHTVFDTSISHRIRKGIDLNFSAENFTDRSYYETQNYFISRLAGEQPLARIHGTPGYPLTLTAGVTCRFSESHQGCAYNGATDIRPSPQTKRISIITTSRRTREPAPANSFQTSRPHNALTMVAPWPMA